MESSWALLLMIVITFFSLGLLVIPALRLKRAIYQVIDRFRTLEGSCLTGVTSIDELGLRSPSLLDGLLRHRDFKPYALQALILEEVVGLEQKGLCLREERVPYFMKKYRL
ncbi:MAG: hypothetical protein HY697_04445 [Deltaproteobacteria bacterium]|nr:hypothetical protein [Deltaproteobacteria bacterium]